MMPAMTDTAPLLTLLAIAMGLFYALGGLVLLRRLPAEAAMDEMLAALGEQTPAAETQRIRVWMVGGALTFASGLALAALSRWAPVVFIAAAMFQAGYLLWSARALPAEDRDSQAGRHATVQAFVIYLLATGFTLWLDRQGVWRSWLQPAWLELLVLLGVTVLVAAALLRPALRTAPPIPSGLAEPDHPAIRLVPEYRMSPLRDRARDEPVDPAALGLSPSLVARIAAWDARFQAIFDDENLFGARFPDLASEQAWFEEGLAVAAAIRQAWPGRLEDDLSGLGTMLRYARRMLAPTEPTPLAEAEAMAPRCGVAEIREAFQRLDRLARERMDIPASDRAAQDGIGAAQRFFAHLLAHVEDRYAPELQKGLDGATAETRRQVEAAIAEQGRA